MIEKQQIVSEVGYEFKKDNQTFYEFHVDDHENFQKACSHLPYGGHLSVRMPPNTKPLIILGQDDCIFKQYLFTKGVWVMPDGTRQLIPKEEGHGIMISSLCSRELGYGCLLSKEDLDAINEKRKNQHYSDKAAAIMLHGTSKKSILTCSPFVRELSYGAGHDGYWSYEHMVLQLEDRVDVLHHTHPQFDYLFLLDHSNGHDRLQEDGLSISKINIKFGGKQPRMRSSTLSSSHFSPYHTIIIVIDALQ